ATKFKCNDNLNLIISPDPPIPSESLTLSASGTVKNDVEDGIVDADIQVFNKNNILNDSFLGGESMFTAKKGEQFNATLDISPLPDNFKIVMTVTASDVDGNIFGCAKKTFDFSNKN
ncbi:21523_t:CDS:1, partial [Dentiscutata erythropus]